MKLNYDTDPYAEIEHFGLPGLPLGMLRGDTSTLEA